MPHETSLGALTPARALALLRGRRANPQPGLTTDIPQRGDASLRLLKRVGEIDPTDSTHTARRADSPRFAKRSRSAPTAVIREVTDSKLMGRGGAAFPTGRKWEAVAKQTPRPHYLICNADESEPGTFKDRVLLDGDPFADRRGDDDRRDSPPAASTASSIFAANTRWAPSECRMRSTRRARTDFWAMTFWAAA